MECTGDDADFQAQFAPIGLAVAVSEEIDITGAGREVAEEGLEEGSLAAAVGAEDGPVLAALHAPVEAVQNDVVAAGDAQTGDIEDRRRARHGQRRWVSPRGGVNGRGKTGGGDCAEWEGRAGPKGSDSGSVT